MSDIPNFNADPEMEQLLDENPLELDEQALIDVQLYKSKKLQARRDAGEAHSEPEWDPIQPGDFVGELSADSNGSATQESERETTEPDDSDDASNIETTADSNETDDVSRESEAPSPAELEADNQIEYYQNLKENYRIVEGGTNKPSTTSDNNEATSTSTGDDSATESPPTSAESHDGSTPAGNSPQETENFAVLVEQIEQLINQVDRYHEQTLELKDEIAELREENAKLREQV